MDKIKNLREDYSKNLEKAKDYKDKWYRHQHKCNNIRNELEYILHDDEPLAPESACIVLRLTYDSSQPWRPKDNSPATTRPLIIAALDEFIRINSLEDVYGKITKE